MKILLVQVKGFENNSLENEIKAFFESKNFEVKDKIFELSEAAKIPEVLLKDSVSIDYMIGVGLAGFFVLSETNSNSRIVINPWMSPSLILSQKETVSHDLLTLLKRIESRTYDWVDAEMRCITYGIFCGDYSEYDKEQFLKVYGRNISGVNNFCIKGFLKRNLYNCLENVTKYFDYFKRLGNWQSLEFFH